MSYNLPPGCSGRVDRSTDSVECARCRASVEHTFLSEMGGRTDDGYDCGECSYHEDDPLPGEGYCAGCWKDGGQLTPAKSGICAECAESAREDAEDRAREGSVALDCAGLVALIGLCLSAAYAVPVMA